MISIFNNVKLEKNISKIEITKHEKEFIARYSSTTSTRMKQDFLNLKPPWMTSLLKGYAMALDKKSKSDSSNTAMIYTDARAMYW